jgi:hypothetical protein
MIAGLSHKKKNRLLGIASLFLLLAIYRLGIKNTLNARQEYAALNEKAGMLDRMPAESSQMEKELAAIETGIKRYGQDSSEHQQQLLDLLTQYCQENRTVLREFPQTIISENGDLQVETNHFVIQGGFHELLLLVYTLEQKQRIGRIASVQYQLRKETKTKTTVLTATVYLQNIKKKTT